MREVTTVTGTVLSIDEECFDDIELLEALVSIEKGDVSLLPASVDRIFGEEKKRFYDSLRNEKGRVSVTAVMEEIKHIVGELGRKNF